MTPIPAPPMPASNSVRNRPWAAINKAPASSLMVSRLVILFLLLLGNVSHSSAQSASFWSEQKKIPNYYPFAQQPPYMIADQNHTIHAFNSQPLDLEAEISAKALYYRQWTQDGGWTYPNDILVDSMGGDIEILDAASNSSGVVYLIFQKDFQNIYFTYAYLADAGRSTAWAMPIQIAGQSTHVGVGLECLASMVVDDKGNIVVVYSGDEAGEGLYSTYSSDNGNNWSQPYPVHLSGDESVVATDPELILGKSGKAHVVWSTFKSDGFGGPGYYAHFDLANSTWSDPVPLDIPGIRTPSVIEYDDDLFVSYYHFSSNGNWWRRSSDGGNTWTAPNQLSPLHVGTNGRVSFVIDSANTLYAFFGERINDLNHGMWQSTWMDGSWSDPEAVVKGRNFRDVPGEFGFDPGAARAIISNGNLVLVSWSTDGFAGVNGAWYSYKMLNAPELPAIPNVEPTIAVPVRPTNTPAQSTAAELTTPPSISLEGLDRRPPIVLFNPQTSIFAGVIFALVAVVGLVVLSIIDQSRKS